MSDQYGNQYGGAQPENTGQYPAPGQQPGQWSDPGTGYQQPFPQQQYVQPDPAYTPPPIAPMTVPTPSSGSSKKSSPLFPILLALAMVAAGVLAFLWRSSTSDADTAKKQAADAQAQISTVTKKAATDVAAAKKATDSAKSDEQAAISTATAQAKTASDAAIAKVRADAAAAVAKAQADATAAIAQAKTDAGSTSGDLQKKLDAADAALAASTAALTAEQAKGTGNISSLQICQAFAKTSNDIVPDLNNFVALAGAINSNNTSAAQVALNAINASGFDSNKNTWNDALHACLNTPAA